MESSYSRLAPAVPTLQLSKDRERQILLPDAPRSEAAYEDSLHEPQRLERLSGGSEQQNPSLCGQTLAEHEASRDSFRAYSTSHPTRTGCSECHERGTPNKSLRIWKWNSDASTSRTRSKASSRNDQNGGLDRLSQHDGQHEVDPCLWRRKEDRSAPTDRWGHVDPLYRAARLGCQPPRRTRSASRTKLEKGRARVTSSQSDCSSQPGNTTGRRTTLVVVDSKATPRGQTPRGVT